MIHLRRFVDGYFLQHLRITLLHLMISDENTKLQVMKYKVGYVRIQVKVAPFQLFY
jgi:hypothetical protein